MTCNHELTTYTSKYSAIIGPVQSKEMKTNEYIWFVCSLNQTNSGTHYQLAEKIVEFIIHNKL